ncbi:hypothetical protein IAR55_006052 [Kwoniella newhampshirensis]|uniref:Uncharacterized protein n=1 Tax=Kwoniella newhampshirensis TaxID=1651941 RepID=A0AAW0YUN9_9TREE
MTLPASLIIEHYQSTGLHRHESPKGWPWDSLDSDREFAVSSFSWKMYEAIPPEYILALEKAGQHSSIRSVRVATFKEVLKDKGSF